MLGIRAGRMEECIVTLQYSALHSSHTEHLEVHVIISGRSYDTPFPEVGAHANPTTVLVPLHSHRGSLELMIASRFFRHLQYRLALVDTKTGPWVSVW